MEVHSQTEYPYVSFMEETLPNHAYVNLSLVGDDTSGNDSVQCHTDLVTCCHGSNGPHRGDWIPPDSKEKLLFFSETEYLYSRGYGIISEARGPQRVDMRCSNNVDMPSGIFRCRIATEAVHDDSDISVRESVYVGLYASGGIYVHTYIHTCIYTVLLFSIHSCMLLVVSCYCYNYNIYVQLHDLMGQAACSGMIRPEQAICNDKYTQTTSHFIDTCIAEVEKLCCDRRSTRLT